MYRICFLLGDHVGDRSKMQAKVALCKQANVQVHIAIETSVMQNMTKHIAEKHSIQPEPRTTESTLKYLP